MNQKNVGQVAVFTYTNQAGETKKRQVYITSVDLTTFDGHDFTAYDTRRFRFDRVQGTITYDKDTQVIDVTNFSSSTVASIMSDMEKKKFSVAYVGEKVVAVKPLSKTTSYEFKPSYGGVSVAVNTNEFLVQMTFNPLTKKYNVGRQYRGKTDSSSDYDNSKEGLVSALKKMADLVERAV